MPATARRASFRTLCPLAQPHKAIGLEPPIEPWLASLAHTTAATPLGEQRRRRRLAMKYGSFAKPILPWITGAGCRREPSPPVKGEIFLLTSPFIERVNSAPQRRRSSVEGGSTYVVVGETWKLPSGPVGQLAGPKPRDKVRHWAGERPCRP